MATATASRVADFLRSTWEKNFAALIDRH